jgi:glycosyltransferase involved in cell wall biosynthesis
VRAEAQPHWIDASADEPQTKELLVDVSVIAFHDAGTGIQRVTRAIFNEFKRLHLSEFKVRPVAASRTIDYHYLPDDFSIGTARPDLSAFERVRPHQGSVFLGLDLASMIMPHHERQLVAWRQAGMAIHIFLFDMLPLLHGEWFRAAARRNFRRWLRVVERQADTVICQCPTVADQFERWNNRWWPPIPRRRLKTLSIPLSGELSGSVPSMGLPDNVKAIENWMARKHTILMVGTVEPRKGYDQALAAFELLWRQSPANAPQLMIIGKAGWKTGSLQKKLRERSSIDGPLLWISDATDELLERIYSRASLLLFASRGEGFGLPIPEALHRGLPVLFRDLPELKQFVGPGTAQFKAATHQDLAHAIIEWLNNPPADTAGNSHAHRNWDAVAIELANALQLRLAPRQIWDRLSTAMVN